ncbi:YciI family protein [Actinocorallia libanotica]|uniref:YciI family protein n=1 Tax=Actinocorallia libanotica TaxID=46162 RepID=A0ABP4B817_9ACTN
MHYLVILKSRRPTAPPSPELMDAMMLLGDEATKSGALVDTGGLLPSGRGGARVRLEGGELTVVDGPFPEPGELISYVVYQVADRDEAIEWASRFLRLYRDMWPGWEGEADVLRVFGEV